MNLELIFSNMMTLDQMVINRKLNQQEASQIYSKLYSQWYELTQIPNGIPNKEN